MSRLAGVEGSMAERVVGEGVHDHFMQHALKSPGATALRSVSGALSYRELDVQSSQLARLLVRHGVKPGERIALSVDRSPDTIVSILAILRAGGVYVPIEPSWPAARIAHICETTNARVLVCDGEAPTLLQSRMETVLSWKDLRREIADFPEESFAVAVAQDAPAYVMFTSGSTGEPKGVTVPHRAIIRLVVDVDYVALGAAHTVLHAAPLAFDASTFEVFGALLTGACLALHPERVPTPQGLASSIKDLGVTTAWLTAGLFNVIVDESPAALRGLRQLLIGGEALSVRHVRRAMQELEDLQLINGYGPTETTTFALCHSISRDIPPEATSIPVGTPIRDTMAYVLSANGTPVAPGETGELYIGGSGVALGYEAHPELTAERFVPNPFVQQAGATMYRTGDLVRQLSDGTYDYAGRTDTQIKISGYRIEPGEIEARLKEHTSVRDAVVVVKQRGESDQRVLVAYVVPGAGADTPDPAGLRKYLADELPVYMVPRKICVLGALPLTANGKVDTRALPDPWASQGSVKATRPTSSQVEQAIAAVVQELLGVSAIDVSEQLFDAGLTSLMVVRAVERLRQRHGLDVPAVVFFEQPTIRAIAANISGLPQNSRGAAAGSEAPAPVPIDSENRREPIAIIGMAARYPGAANVEEFWANLCEGRDTIRHFAPDELDPLLDASLVSDPQYVAARGIVEDVDMFDAGFFGMGPREAQLMDPQQRVLLELVVEALDHAGCPADGAEVVGVFAGVYNNSYQATHLSRRQDLVESYGAFNTMLLNEKDYVASRVAHKLGLRGPALSIHTACSTSAVTVCEAVQSLRDGQCDVAVAGGVSINVPTNAGYLYQEGAMLSPDGATRPFDASGAGTVFSDGAGVVVLKPLSRAMRDGDTVYCVIRGIAVNNDGADKASFTAPSIPGQAAVVAHAQRDAGMKPRDVSYIESHGTATPLGDPIEFEALRRVFREDTADVGFCRLGGVKGNIGHTVIAAGAAGIIKTALSLAREVIPGTAHFVQPNPALKLEESPFTVSSTLTPWPRGERPRIAGVSSFGVGGTNAHLILEEAPVVLPHEHDVQPQLLILSARTAEGVQTLAKETATFLSQNPRVPLADVANTLQSGRRRYPHRIACVSSSSADAAGWFGDATSEQLISGTVHRTLPPVAFMFPGQGAQYPQMGAALYARSSAFRAAFDRCARIADELIGCDFRRVVHQDAGESAADALRQTGMAQPALFATEFALAEMWRAEGVEPVATIGHSVGEFVSATLAGVFTPEDAMRLVCVRGRLMQALPAGDMLSVRLPAADVVPHLGPALSLAADNSSALCVVAGRREDILELRDRLEATGAQCRVLHTSHAFHSSMMDPVVDAFAAEVAKVTRTSPTSPFVSGVTGDWIRPDEAVDPRYWARHLREPVQFRRALATLLGDHDQVLLELGPRGALSAFARPLLGRKHIRFACSVMGESGGPDGEVAAMLNTTARLWVHGLHSGNPRLEKGTARRIPLPTYPFQRARYWVDVTAGAPKASSGQAADLSKPVEASTPPGPPAARPVAALPLVARAATSQPSIPPQAMSHAPRRESLTSEITEFLEQQSGLEIGVGDSAVSLVELGFDSLILTQVALALSRKYSTKFTFRQLMEQYSTIDRLVDHLDALLPKSEVPVAAPPPPAASIPQVLPASVAPAMQLSVPVPATPAPAVRAASAPAGSVQLIIEQQLQLMTQQLALLTGTPVVSSIPVADAGATLQAPLTAAALEAPPTAEGSGKQAAAGVSPPPTPDEEAPEIGPSRGVYDAKKAFGAAPRITVTRTNEFTPMQRARLDAFVRRYNAKTAKSKAFTEANRRQMADPRVVTGFRPPVKELVYPIVIERSAGSRMWDIDGNEYIDLLSGFGSNLLGWTSPVVVKAVTEQMSRGFEVGPQHPLTGEVASLFRDVTGVDRVAFCNTGSEAVLGAIRIARTVTGRPLVVIFSGGYHGINDEVIVRARRDHRGMPAAPGIMPATAENVLVLDYGTDESLALIKERASDIAAVIVEPVQSRRPDFQPREFLESLRQLTTEQGIVYVWDEIVTGFRAALGGAQAHFGIKADLATYGKIVGGGFPIGVIAGKREFMDALDGGDWRFGDASVPEVGVTYFAGTFVRHPLALAAARAMLTYMKEKGPGLQKEIAAKTDWLALQLNTHFTEVGVPLEVRHFTSVWKTFTTAEVTNLDLLFYLLRERGIHVYDGFPCFMTASHSAADLQAVVDAFKGAIAELQEGGFLPGRTEPRATVKRADEPPVPGARMGRDKDGTPAWFAPDPKMPGQFVRVASV